MILRTHKYMLLKNHVVGYVVIERSLLPADWQSRFVSQHTTLDTAHRAKHVLEAREYRAATDYEAQDRIG